MMSSCMAIRMQRHLDQLYHVFSFSKKKNNSEMIFDPTETNVGDAQFAK